MIAFGTALAKERKALRRTQGDIAHSLRTSQASLSHIERGAETRLSTFVDLAHEVGLEPVLVPKSLVSVVRDIVHDHSGPVDHTIRRKFE